MATVTKKFDDVRKWYSINHSKDNLMLIKIHKKTIAWKSVVLELLQFEDILNKGKLWRQWRESFIFFPSGKKNSCLRPLKKLFLYFSQINIKFFWKNRQEISEINWCCMIIHLQLEENWQDCFASHLQYWLHAICLIRHGQPCGLAHIKQLQDDWKLAGIDD